MYRLEKGHAPSMHAHDMTNINDMHTSIAITIQLSQRVIEPHDIIDLCNMIITPSI